MDPQIEYLLTKVVKRYRSQRWAWLLAIFWLSVAGAVLAGWIPLPRDLAFDGRNHAMPIAILAGIFLLLWVACRLAYRDLNAAARHVESAFPTLEQKLLTSTTPSVHASPYFRRRLVQDVVRHAQAFDWTKTVAPFRFWTAWGAQWLALVGLIAAIAFTWSSNSDGVMPYHSVETVLRDPNAWLVEPGDTEIERGSDLVITFRLAHPDSSDALVEPNVWIQTATTPSKLTMSRALNDATYGTSIRRVDAPLDYRVEAAGRTSRTYHVDVFEYPALVRSDAEIQPPSYTMQPEKRIEDTRKVTVAEGSELTWICKLNKPVPLAELIDERGDATPLVQEADDPTLYRVSITMVQSKRWKLRLVDEEGRSAKFDEQFSARVLPNNPPAIQVARPADQRVSALQEIELEATVTDDYSVRKTGVTYALSGQDNIDVTLWESSEISPASRKQVVAHTIFLEDMNAKPDQLLSYYFWMEDLDRDGEVRRVEGDMFFAEVRPFEELFRPGDSNASSPSSSQNQGSQAAGMAEELAELQRKIMSGTWNTTRDLAKANPNKSRTDIETLIESQQQARLQSEELSESIESEASVAILQEVQEAMDQATESLENAAVDPSTDSLRQAFRAERSAYEGLLRLRSREFEINQSQQSQSQSRSQSSSQRQRQQQLEQLKLEDDPSRYESESKPDTPDEAAQREMRQVMNRLDELARRQQDLNEQLRELDLALQEAETEEAKK
ncbi:MAG: DUF4175 domain-containing protein, partial [Pirellula sp.]|nr:DUF4175 domain-containing protein [Pirellula sp.]